MVEKKKEIHVLTLKSTRIHSVLKELRSDLSENPDDEFRRIPFVIVTAAYLECLINDKLISHFMRLWGDGYSAEIEPYLRMPFPQKINQIVPILTGNEYKINRDHVNYKKLKSLVAARNRAVHAVSEKTIYGESETTPHPFYQDVMVPPFDTRTDTEMLGIEKDYPAEEMFQAVERFEKWFFDRCPDRLEHVAIVRARGESNLKVKTKFYSKSLK